MTVDHWIKLAAIAPMVAMMCYYLWVRAHNAPSYTILVSDNAGFLKGSLE